MKRKINNEGKIWLNVASSIYVLENFINLDNHIFIRFIKYYSIIKKVLPKKYHVLFTSYNDASKKAILQKHDCRKTLKYGNNSVDHILCSHFLEHVFPEDANNILKDFERVLKTGGTLHMIVPDLEELINKYLKNKENNIEDAADIFILDSLLSKKSKGTLKYRLMEFSGGFGLQHRWMYDFNSLKKLLLNYNFELIEMEEIPSKTFRLNDGSVHLFCRKK